MSHKPALFLCENCGDFKPESQRSLTGNCTDCDPEIEMDEYGEPVKEDINDEFYYKGRGDRDTDEL